MTEKIRVALTPMAVLIESLGHVHLLDEMMELDVCQRFCEAISNHFFRWNVRKLDSLRGYFISDVMVLDIDVFCPRVEYWVVCQSY